MFRKLMLAAVVALAVPVLAAAHDDEFESDWGWIDDGAVIEEYDFEGGDVSVDMDAPGSAVSFETFHDGLSPHGQWVTVGAYGRVWHPRGVPAGWRPYYHGRWEWTHEGWLWVSTEPWGWATYHYGRWAFDSFHGWVWVPGYQWAPAWVSWRFGTDYIGWAPLGPGLSVYVTNYPVVYDHWCFVPSARFVGVPVHSHAFVGPRARSIYTRTQPAPPRATVHGSVTPAWGGPARPFVEKRAGRAIAPVRVQPVASPTAAAAAPSRQGVVPVYRPEAARPSRSGAAANRSGAVAAPGRQGGSGANAITAPGRSGAASPGVSAPRGRSEQGSQVAPARPGAAPRRDASRDSAPPAAAPPPASSPPRSAPGPAPARPRSDRIDSGRSSSRGSDSSVAPPARGGSGPSVAPPARGGSSRGGGSIAAPPRSGGGGGSSYSPPRGGGNAGRSAATVGGGGRGGGSGGGGGGRSSGHAAPNRR